MNDRRVQIWIAVVAGLALAALLLLAGEAAAGPPSPTTQPHVARATGSWSSTWVPINQGETLTFSHNLGGDPDDYAVELWFWDEDADGLGIHRRNYGGLEVDGAWFGAHWQNLTANTVQVYRQPDDATTDRVRIRVSDLPTDPDYASEWKDIDPGQTILFDHNVGITATDLTVALWFSSTARGIHHYGYGGLAVDGPQEMRGGHWHKLTNNTVLVSRHPHDTDIEQVRVLVVHGASPQYDSLADLGGWRPIAPGTAFTFDHNLNWNPDMMLVRGECYSPTVSARGGIHKWFAGGNHDWFNGGQWQGAYMRNLTSNTVAIARLPDDSVCPRVRVRVYVRTAQVYLPLIVRSP